MRTERSDIENFLYAEARLLDSGQFTEWLTLFTPDAIYWAPAGNDDIDPMEHVSIIYDDVAALTKRVERLQSGHAYAQEPASRVHRIISNVETGAAVTAKGEYRVTCMMLLIELARHRQTIHSARCEFDLEWHDENWKIRRKKINLLKNNEVLEATPFLL